MRASRVGFLRAMFHRWAEMGPEACPAVAQAPRVVAVGALHGEDFGTRRDIEGRLAWQINDFAEEHGWVRRLAPCEFREPAYFRRRLRAMRAVTPALPAGAPSALDRVMPGKGLRSQIEQRGSRRVAGTVPRDLCLLQDPAC
jgi:hypothetical protein